MPQDLVMSVDTQVQTGAFHITTVDASGARPGPDYELILGKDMPNVTIEGMGSQTNGLQIQAGTVAVGRRIRFRAPQELGNPWVNGKYTYTGQVSTIERLAS